MYLTDPFHAAMPLFSIIDHRWRQNTLYVVNRKKVTHEPPASVSLLLVLFYCKYDRGYLPFTQTTRVEILCIQKNLQFDMVGERPATKYSHLSLDVYLFKTDTSLRRTPGVGPCFFSVTVLLQL